MSAPTAGGDAPVLTFRAASFGYAGNAAIEGVDGEVRRGEALALVGPNGAGKSTLLKGIVGEARRLSGSVDLHGLAVPDLAYLPQQPEIDRSFPITVVEFAATGLWRRLGAFCRYRPEHRAEVAAAVARVGLQGHEDRLIGTLSGGQMQRLLFARTLLQDAPLVLLDEPFTAVDAQTEADLLAVLRAWHEEGRTVIAALHDLAQVRSAFPRTLLVSGRVVAWGDTAAVLTRENLLRANGREILPPMLADPAAGAAARARGAA